MNRKPESPVTTLENLAIEFNFSKPTYEIPEMRASQNYATCYINHNKDYFEINIECLSNIKDTKRKLATIMLERLRKRYYFCDNKQSIDIISDKI